MKKRKMRQAVTGFCLWMLLGMHVLAADDIRVAGSHTNEEDISLYVKGLGSEIREAGCQVGTGAERQVAFENAADMENPPKTLIMIDNSLSISESDREKIYAFLMAFVDDKEDREEIAVAVFAEELNKIVDYTADRQTLENAVESLTYQDQETYLTDVLYDVIEEGLLGTEDCYKKIVIISDGVDNKAIGYTKDELYSLIKEKSYPIYTLGCVNKNNEEQLKNMFAVSRMTGAKDFLLDEIENVETAVDDILEDSRAVRFCIVPEAEEMDGSNKNILLKVRTAEGELEIEAGVKMPFRAAKQEEVPVLASVTEEETKETQARTEESQEEGRSEPEYQETTGFPAVPAAIGAGAAAAGVFALFRKKSGKNEGKDSGNDREEDSTLPEEAEKTILIPADEERTQMMPDDDEETQMTSTLCLTDETNPDRFFQVPMDDVVTIGRNAKEVSLVIDYDRSVSGRHCQISERKGRFYVKDLKSSNGTFLDGTRIGAEEELYSGCVLTLGRVRLKVEINES